MTYPPEHEVPAAPEGKEWYRVKKGLIKEGDWLGCIKEKAYGAVGSSVDGWTVYRLRDIPARYFTSATKFWDSTAYIRYVGDKGTIVNADGTDWPHAYNLPLSSAVGRVKSGDWKEITAKEALALTKPASETELLRAEVAALKAEVADLKEARRCDLREICALEDKLRSARAAVETLKSI